MAINPSLEKWIKASVADHFNTYRSSLRMYVEADTKDTNSSASYFELRFNGINAKRLVGEYDIDVLINCLVCTTVNKNDAYAHETDIGIVQACFKDSILIYKYGTAAGDTGAFLDCLSIVGDIKTRRFGQIEEGVKQQQSSVSAVYTFTIAS